jgi:NodT family efflux transporter outer membrane factor (OMF) lipoprotein
MKSVCDNLAIFPTTLRRLSTVLLVGVSLSGCALPGLLQPEPTVVEPVETLLESDTPPPVWVEPAPERQPTLDWIGSFNDPALSALVDEARQTNPTVLRAVAQLDAALATRKVSRSALYPTLSASNSLQRSEGGVGFFAGSTNASIGLNAAWEVDLFKRIRDQVEASNYAVEGSAYDLASLQLSIVGQIASGWFRTLEAEQLVELSARDIETQERALRLTQRRFESGVTGSSDVRLARSALANSQALEQSRLQARNASLRAVQVLARDYPDAKMSLPTNLPELPDFEGAGTPTDLLARRPDILAAEARIREAGLNVDVARKALYPSLRISAGASDDIARRSNDPNPPSFLKLFDLNDLAFQLGEQITAPIFQGGRLRAQVAQQRALMGAQFESYVSTVYSAYEEIENALDAETRLGLREEALRTSLVEAQKAEERLELRYVEGLASVLQLLDAQSRRINAEGQLIGVRAERLQNRVRLHVALGGGGYTLIPSAAQDVIMREDG